MISLFTDDDLRLDRSTHILLAESDEELSLLLGNAIRSRGYTIRCASNGAEAVRMLTTEQYALAVLDTRLRNPGGLRFLAGVRIG